MAKQTIGEFLAIQRKAKGFTQAYVSEILGISNKTLSAWETNKAYPDILTLPALAELYGVTADEILNGERNAESTLNQTELSGKAQTKLYKGKLTQNSTQNLVLTCVAIFASIVCLIGWVLFPVASEDKMFWAALCLVIIGSIITIIVLFLAVALSRILITRCISFENESLVSTEKNFILNVDFLCLKTVKNTGLIWICCGFLGIICWIISVVSGITAVVSIVFYGIMLLVGALIVLVSAVCKNVAVKKYGTAEQIEAIKYNVKLSALSSITVLPLIACLILVILASAVEFPDKVFNGNAAELKSYMHTLVIQGYPTEIELNIPEDLGEEAQTVADGVTAYIKSDKLFVDYKISYKYDVLRGSCTAYLIEIDNCEEAIYNVRYYRNYHKIDVRTLNGSYSVYEYRYLNIGNGIFISCFLASFAVIAAGATVYLTKRKKLKITL